MNVPINYLAVVVAALASVAIGAAWYSPMLFGKPWMRMMGWTGGMPEEQKKAAAKSYALMFVGTLVMTYVLAHFIYIASVVTVTDALVLGFWIWLGFVATVMLGVVLWEGKPWKLYLLNVGYQLVSLLVAAVILALWV